MSQELPSFDLVVATVGRTKELGVLLDSLVAQDYPRLRVIVVDQNDDARLDAVLADRTLELDHVRAARGLSHARNVGLERITAEVVGFPDDDCTYAPGILEKVARRFAVDDALDGLCGMIEDERGAASTSWKHDSAVLDRQNLWNRANSAATFVRRDVVERVGSFDEQLGLGSGTPWSSGEEIDYLIRAVDAGARIEYEPALVVTHPLVEDDARIGYRDGATVGYLLRRHGYPALVVARMMFRPIGGALVSLVRLDVTRSRYHVASLRGRVRGYRGASSSNSAA